MTQTPPPIGVIGGTGLYQFDALVHPRELALLTPFGPPSDTLACGEIDGRTVYFIPRHGRGHVLLPSEINHRANLWALRSLGVRWLISVSAVGSLQDAYRPCDVVLPSQFFDRTSRRDHHTFFGSGIVAHVSFDQPTAPRLRSLLLDAARTAGATAHDGGTYVNIDGPAFSSGAESELNHRLGFDVVGMTTLAEAKLAREAEIAFAAVSFVTDYDCWKHDEQPVTTAIVRARLEANAEVARQIIGSAITRIPIEPDWPEHSSLSYSLITDKARWPADRIEVLRPILAPYL